MTNIWALRIRGAIVIAGVALAWVIVYRLNAVAFSDLEHSTFANWVFLPAALRVIAVLLLREKGAAGLTLGAYLTMPQDAAASLPHELLIAASSATAPLIGIWVCQRLFPIAADLSGLRGSHVVALSIATALANSCVLTTSVAMTGQLNGDANQIVPIFVGDMLGAAIVLFAIIAVLWIVRLGLRHRLS